MAATDAHQIMNQRRIVMGQIIKAVVDGEEREFEVLKEAEYIKGTHYFYDGQLLDNKGKPYRWSVPLRLVRKQHVFGPITYEETGEVTKTPPADTYYLGAFSGNLVCLKEGTTTPIPVTIVKPLI